MGFYIANIIIWCMLEIYQSSTYIIDCLPNEDCFISCDGIQSCMNTIINCPINGDCNIHCYAQRSCQDTIINATYSSGNLNILCEGSSDDCRRIKIYGSTLDSNTNDLNLTCNGESRSCINSYINCPAVGDCIVSCNGYRSCEQSVINGTINGDLNVYCNEQRACSNAIFDGTYSFQLDVKGCKRYQSCLNLSIYCPSKTNHSAMCIIQGNDNLSPGLQIYSINGWDNVYIDYDGTFNESYNGKMFCGYDYNISCDIAVNDWSCANTDDYCNNMDIEQTIKPQSTMTMNETVLFIGHLRKEFKLYQDEMSMLIIGGGLVFMALCCVICGIIRKAIWKRNIETKTEKVDNKMCYITQASEIPDESDGETDIAQEIDIEINVFSRDPQQIVYKRNEDKSEDIDNNETQIDQEMDVETNVFQRCQRNDNAKKSNDTDNVSNMCCNRANISELSHPDQHNDNDAKSDNKLYSWVDIDVFLKQLKDNDENKEEESDAETDILTGSDAHSNTNNKDNNKKIKVPPLLKDYQL